MRKRSTLAFRIYLFALMVGCVLGGAADCSWARPSRIALLVDNSGSMYGKCGRNEVCQNIMPEVKRALAIVLEMLYAYNQKQPPDQQLEMVLTLFGGVFKGREEFEEIKLGPDLKQNLEILNQRLMPARTNYYQETDFALAFRRMLALLQNRGKADLTIFLTDAVKGGSSQGGASLDLSYFGNTYLYSLMRDTAGLVEWQRQFEAQHVQAETIYIEKGHQVLASFATVFLKFLIPESQEQYFSYEELELPANRMVLPLAKLTQSQATYYVIFHGSETPQLERVEFGGSPVAGAEVSSQAGVNLLTVELREGTAAGPYTLILKPLQQPRQTMVIGLENTTLVLVDRLNPLENRNVYKRNDEVSFHFGFAVEEGGRKTFLNEGQERAFLQLVNFSFEMQERNGGDRWAKPEDRHETRYFHQFSPTGHDDAVYDIMTGWSYSGKNPQASQKAGSFVISRLAGQELALEFSSSRGDLWHGLETKVRAVFLQPAKLPPHVQQLDRITIRDQATRKLYMLTRPGEGAAYEGSLGRMLEPGAHAFELVDPSPAGPPEIVLTGRELKIKPRQIALSIKETFSRQNPEEEGFLGKLRDGFEYLLGRSDEGFFHRSEEVSQFPVSKDVLLQYYDKDSYRLETQSKVEPVFAGETVNVEAAYRGGRSYIAEHAYLPGFLGIFQGRAETLKDALTIDLSPDPSQAKLGETLSLAMEKKGYDWEIPDILTPKPELQYRFVLTEGDDRVPLGAASIVLNIKTKPYGKEIITGMRWFAFLALIVLAALFLLVLLALLIMYRGYIVQRQGLCDEIMGRVPWDFCGSDLFPDASWRLLGDEALKRGLDKPGRVLQKALEEQNHSLLKRIWRPFKVSQLKALRDRCKATNLDSHWDFEVSAGSLVIVCGSELNPAGNVIRLRDDDLPPVIGQLKIQQAGEGQPSPWETEVRFSVKSHLVVQHNGRSFIPPIKHDLEVRDNDVLAIGLNINELKFKLTVNVTEKALTVTSQKL